MFGSFRSPFSKLSIKTTLSKKKRSKLYAVLYYAHRNISLPHTKGCGSGWILHGSGFDHRKKNWIRTNKFNLFSSDIKHKSTVLIYSYLILLWSINLNRKAEFKRDLESGSATLLKGFFSI